MLATMLMALSAAVILTLGLLHLALTLRGRLLLPRDAALHDAMRRTAPVISRQTTMWKAWIGFNVSHSMGAILFGLVYGYLALAHGALLFASPFLLLVGLAMLLGLVVLGKLYWFRTPLRGIALACVCYVASLALTWV